MVFSCRFFTKNCRTVLVLGAFSASRPSQEGNVVVVLKSFCGGTIANISLRYQRRKISNEKKGRTGFRTYAEAAFF